MNPATTADRCNGAPGPGIDAFEALDFDVAQFDHEAHVYVAWLYLQQYDQLEAISRYRDTLKRLTASLGIPEKYHETITWFYMIAVAENATGKAADNWSTFKDANAALFRRHPSLICSYYSNTLLESPLARGSFVLPDIRAPQPSPQP